MSPSLFSGAPRSQPEPHSFGTRGFTERSAVHCCCSTPLRSAQLLVLWAPSLALSHSSPSNSSLFIQSAFFALATLVQFNSSLPGSELDSQSCSPTIRPGRFPYLCPRGASSFLVLHPLCSRLERVLSIATFFSRQLAHPQPSATARSGPCWGGLTRSIHCSKSSTAVLPSLLLPTPRHSPSTKFIPPTFHLASLPTDRSTRPSSPFPKTSVALLAATLRAANNYRFCK